MKSPRAGRLLVSLLGLLLVVSLTTTGTAAATQKAPTAQTPATALGQADTAHLGDQPETPIQTQPITITPGEHCRPTAVGSRERRAGAVEACVTTSTTSPTSTTPATPSGRQSRAIALPSASPSTASDEGACTITAAGQWTHTRFGYCLSGLTVLYVLKDSNGKELGTGTLSVATSATLPGTGTSWREYVTVTMTGAERAVTSLTAKFKVSCSAGCTASRTPPWYGGQLVKGQSVSGSTSYSSSPAVGTKVDFTTSYNLYVTSPGADITDPDASWSNPKVIRCDDDVRDTSSSGSEPGPGCVVPSFMPVVKMSTIANGSDSGAAAAGYLWAQNNLADGWGRSRPLTRAKNGAADRTSRTCEGSQPFEARDSVPDDSCGDFPFGATHEGGTDGARCAEIIPKHTGSGWHVYQLIPTGTGMPCVRAHVPKADIQSAETQLAAGFANQRVLEREQFKLEITSTTPEPQGACLLSPPTGSGPSGDGWISNTNEPVAQRNKTTAPPGPAGTRPTKATACLGKTSVKGSDAAGDITGWQDAQITARPYAPPGAQPPFGLARCHLIANILGGQGRITDGQDNLVPCWQLGMNTGTPSMRTFETAAQKTVTYDSFGPNDAIFYEVTPHYRDATSTIPDSVAMSATIQRADGTTEPLFPDVVVANTKGADSPINLGN
ncbi:DNA/RNA non-specific endonuclease [Streptomyces sp. TLI_146]|uniref:DNA/RNA non-specific endonuclease n=1 Tax=Streptomyces sp. TLI_146 TaxID=1938858 RepID=UPI000CAF6E0F|nr:DNA/RNA non-specific endonuclease [Streptomyces sp. TLI_146]PKV89960.1 DNA/RNA non-specific endonuclease [Streptomyces sp. TLI_146]